MQDVLIKVDAQGLYDIQIEGSDFASAEGFETAIPVSYFTDARASEVQVQNAQNRRGWVGNILFDEREVGSLLWLLDQARMAQDTINSAKSFAHEGLQWMINDNVAKNIDIKVEQLGTRSVSIYTNIEQINNTVKHYVTLWRNTNFERTL